MTESSALAILAAALWGLSYTLSARLATTYSTEVLLVVTTLGALPVYIMLLLNEGTRAQIVTLVQHPQHVWIAAADILTGFAAAYTILYTLSKGDPVGAAFIETTYPIFIILFSYLLFREVNWNWNTIIGGLVILVGVYIVSRPEAT